VEALLAAALEPAPPPIAELVEPDLAPELPADTESLMALLPTADLYLQDEVQVALHPTLTRVWCRKGRRGQRLIEAPGRNEKVDGFGLVDWRDGWFDGRTAPGRTAAAFCEQVRAAAARSRARGRVAIVLVDNAGTHTAAGSKLVRQMLAELAEHLRLVYTPAYDPDANRIEWLWRPVRRAVTHNHQRREMATLRADLEAEFRHLAGHPADVLAHLGSPGLETVTAAEPLADAA
jgi:transposase